MHLRLISQEIRTPGIDSYAFGDRFVTRVVFPAIRIVDYDGRMSCRLFDVGRNINHPENAGDSEVELILIR